MEPATWPILDINDKTYCVSEELQLIIMEISSQRTLQSQPHTRYINFKHTYPSNRDATLYKDIM